MMKSVTTDDNHSLDCWMVKAKGPSKGGLVILQEIFGVTDQLKGVAEMYSSLGYDTAIPALFDRHQKNAVIPFDQAAKGRELMQSCALEQTLLDIQATVKELDRENSQVAVMGFCWGGGLAIRSAQKINISGAISFYGTALTKYLDGPLKAPLLAHFGLTDDHVPPEILEQVTNYFPDMEYHTYDAGHAFANDARPAYVPAEAELAHDRTKRFLAKLMHGSD